MSESIQKRYATVRRRVKIRNGKNPMMSIKKWNDARAPR